MKIGDKKYFCVIALFIYLQEVNVYSVLTPGVIWPYFIFYLVQKHVILYEMSDYTQVISYINKSNSFHSN